MDRDQQVVGLCVNSDAIVMIAPFRRLEVDCYNFGHPGRNGPTLFDTDSEFLRCGVDDMKSLGMAGDVQDLHILSLDQSDLEASEVNDCGPCFESEVTSNLRKHPLRHRVQKFWWRTFEYWIQRWSTVGGTVGVVPLIVESDQDHFLAPLISSSHE